MSPARAGEDTPERVSEARESAEHAGGAPASSDVEADGADAEAPRYPPTASTVGAQASGFAQRGYGLRFSGSRAGDEGPFAGVALYERAVGLLEMGWLSARYFDELWIGGDGAGWTYSLQGQIAVGLGVPVTDTQRFVLRPHFRGTFRRQAGVFFSALRFPGAEMGWHIEDPRVQLDLVGHFAPLLTGVWETRERRVDLGGFAAGGSVSLSVFPVRFDGDWNLYAGGSFPGVVDEMAAHICSLGGKKAQTPAYRSGDSHRPVHVGPRAADFTWSICFDVSGLRAREASESFSDWTAGISLLLGSFSLLDPAP